MESVILFVLVIFFLGGGSFSYLYLRIYYSGSFVHLVSIFVRFLLATLSHGLNFAHTMSRQIQLMMEKYTPVCLCV